MRSILLRIALIVVVQLSGACTDKEPNQGIVIKSLPETIPLNHYFALDIGLYDSKYAKLTADKIRIEAIMPSHGHGMNVEPIIQPAKQPGHFIANGLLFHMKGDWQIFVYVQLAQSTEKITLDAHL